MTSPCPHPVRRLLPHSTVPHSRPGLCYCFPDVRMYRNAGTCVHGMCWPWPIVIRLSALPRANITSKDGGPCRARTLAWLMRAIEELYDTRCVCARVRRVVAYVVHGPRARPFRPHALLSGRAAGSSGPPRPTAHSQPPWHPLACLCVFVIGRYAKDTADLKDEVEGTEPASVRAGAPGPNLSPPVA